MGSTMAFGDVVKKPKTLCGPGTGFDLVPRSPRYSVQIPAKANGGRSSLSANHTTSFLPVSGLASGAYSEKLFAGTRQRLSGFSQPFDLQRFLDGQASIHRQVVEELSRGRPMFLVLRMT
jgi:hypothetical protein